MSRTITSEERMILLDNPELVMFNPYSVFKTHTLSLGKAIVLPVAALLLVFLWGYLCPDFINEHPKLFAGIGCAVFIIASGSVPVLYFWLDDRMFKNAEADHYAKQLGMLLPEKPECRIAHVLWVTKEKAEGGWILDGKEELFGYSSCVNYFPIEPDTDLAVITGGDQFWAFVKRDQKTERFYQNT